MNWTVQAAGLEFQSDIERLLLLFIEDLEIRWDNSDDSDGDLKITFDRTEQKAVATLTCCEEQQSPAVYRAEATPSASFVQENLHARQEKMLILKAVYDVMHQFTGIRQPWGILTGIRPLKLVHARLEKRQPIETIEQDLKNDYRVEPSRVSLLAEIAKRQLEVVPDLYDLYKEVSIYVGIPFCPTHCAYCTFPAYSMEEKHAYAKEFLRALDLEFQTLGRYLDQNGIPVTSVYVGGGTPTSLNAAELDWMLKSLRTFIPGENRWRELTVEAGRPDTITPDRVEIMKKHGVNRISVNPQTFKAATLKEIGRGHTPDIVDRRFWMVKEAGFENINMDLILGLPGEDLEDVAYTRSRMEALLPDSITVHTLSFKRTAVVNREKQRFEIPHTELVQQMMEETTDWARSLGYGPYYVYRQKDILGNLENVGFAKPGKESIYNILIMEERQCIIGIGGGASTKLIGAHGKSYGRHGNPREPKAYVDTIEEVLKKKLQLLDDLFQRVL